MCQTEPGRAMTRAKAGEEFSLEASVPAFQGPREVLALSIPCPIFAY